MQPYRKRALGHWNQGKGQKGDAEERQYAKREINRLRDEAEENYFYRYKGKRNPNKRARLEYRVKWYEEAIARNSSGSAFLSYLQSGLAAARKALAALDTP